MFRLPPESGNLRPESKAPRAGKAAAAGMLSVKLEIEDPLEDEHGPDNKRSKIATTCPQWNMDVMHQQPQCNPLNEPSPLGLRLRKSPSLLDLIQMRLSQASSSKACTTSSDSPEASKKKKDVKPSSAMDKLKASNFPANLLRIGSWECVSRYEGDLVAKCYFAKRKLVWEVLDGGLKRKIEIQWPDITALKATCPDNGPGTLDLVLSRQPLFFKETNPQPRKHTLWQATSDFTDGQASIQRRHLLQVPQGLLGKHFEKLLQCDPHLNALSKEPDIKLDSPYFEARCSVFEDQDETKHHSFEHIKSEYGSPFQGFHDAASPTGLSSSSMTMSEVRDLATTPDGASWGTSSPSSVMDPRVGEESTSCGTGETKDLNKWDQFTFPGIHPSMSMSDLVNHIGQCISEQITPDNPNEEVLAEITNYLFSDSQSFAASDEKSLISRVNSLCCLLQKDPNSNNMQTSRCGRENDGAVNKPTSISNSSALERKPMFDLVPLDGECNDASACKQPPISRKESFGDLLLHLPRIASLPQFLFNISEEPDNAAS